MATTLQAELIKELPDERANTAQRLGKEKSLEAAVQEILGQGKHGINPV